MTLTPSAPLKVGLEIEQWPLKAPFHIAGHMWEAAQVCVIRLERDGHIGWGEAAGIYYKGDTPELMASQIKPLRSILERGITRHSLQELLPPGGLRNALDCALWDLEAKLGARPAWEVAHLGKPQSLLSTFTCGADDPDKMASTARGYAAAKAIKLKLTGETIDVERVRAVRAARPEVWLGVDANQAFTPASLDRLMPILIDARVQLIEQPFPIGKEALLDGLRSPIPIAADESVQDLRDVEGLVGRFNVINIKLDKCGGLTEGLAIARTARSLGLDTMVGGMMGTSLAVAPAYLLGQLCKVVDLDGPVFLKTDRRIAVRYEEGRLVCPEGIWGSPTVEGSRVNG